MAQLMQSNASRAVCQNGRHQFRSAASAKVPSASRSRTRSTVHCTAEINRRDALLAGVATVALPLVVSSPASAAIEAVPARFLPVDKLSTFQKADQRKEFIRRVTGELKKVLTAADAPATVKLVLNDAGTYDVATGTGGFDGSIVLPEELNRPENVSLKPLVEKLAKAKAIIDEQNAAKGQQPISWADLEVLAARTAVKQAWFDIKLSRAATASGGSLIADNFAADWPVQLGRIDATEPAPTGRIPASDASVEEIRTYLAALGAKPSSGFFAGKPPFWERPAFVVWTAAAADPAAEEARFADSADVFREWKRKYDFSRATVTRTDYEVDFITYLTKLSTLGAKFTPDAYLYPEPLPAIKL